MNKDITIEEDKIIVKESTNIMAKESLIKERRGIKIQELEKEILMI